MTPASRAYNDGSLICSGVRADPVQVPFAVERHSVARVSRTARPVQETDPDLGELPQSSEILPGMQISYRSLTISARETPRQIHSASDHTDVAERVRIVAGERPCRRIDGTERQPQLHTTLSSKRTTTVKTKNTVRRRPSRSFEQKTARRERSRDSNSRAATGAGVLRPSTTQGRLRRCC